MDEFSPLHATSAGLLILIPLSVTGSYAGSGVIGDWGLCLVPSYKGFVPILGNVHIASSGTRHSDESLFQIAMTALE